MLYFQLLIYTNTECMHMNMYSWYSFDGRITHFCVIWSIFCDHFTGVCILHSWYMMMLAVYMAIYNRYPNIQYVIVITWTRGRWPIYLQYMCMYRACSLVEA